MEDQARPPKRAPCITRGVEENRLAKQALSAAYQRLVPILRRSLAGPKAEAESGVCSHPPRRAAGA